MVVKAYKACIEKRNVVNFIAVDYFEKIARYAVEAANHNNGGDPPLILLPHPVPKRSFAIPGRIDGADAKKS